MFIIRKPDITKKTETPHAPKPPRLLKPTWDIKIARKAIARNPCIELQRPRFVFSCTELDDDAKAYLKDFGAATASNGAVGLYHIAGLTPEAVEMGESLIAENAQVYVIDDAELERVKNSYPVMWKDPSAKPKLCFIGCPHLTHAQLREWTDNVCEGLKKSGRKKVAIPTVFTAPPAVCEEFKKTDYAAKLEATGVVLSYICPLMYMNNPLAKKMPVITNSNKLRTYTTSRYYTDSEILDIITKGVK